MTRLVWVVVLLWALSPAATVAAPNTGTTGSVDTALKAFERRDYGAARRLFLPLAENGNAVAQLHLGKMYESGLGVPGNQKEAGKWYALAAALGESDAQYNLALMDEVGTYVLFDPDERGALFRSAAHAGHADAQFRYARSLAAGEPVRAASWFLIAARNGGTSLGEIPPLSREDRRIAGDMAKRCYESKYLDCSIAAQKTPAPAVTPSNGGVTNTAGATSTTDDSRVSLASAAGLALVQVAVRFSLAFATYLVLTFGVGKSRSRPTQQGRWVGACGAALAVAFARTNAGWDETVVGTLVLAATMFIGGFIAGYIWRRFRPIGGLDAAGGAP